MKKYKASEKRVDLYDFGNGITLMNIIRKNNDENDPGYGKMEEIDTYLGFEGREFYQVGHTEGLSKPGVMFSYASYVRMIEQNRNVYLDIYNKNTGGMLYGDNGLVDAFYLKHFKR